ncbi:putative serine/threonine-protein kinase [Auxenochlorella protothecoides]|uniref:Putative serine/threonine-protein kinase n=1 Tax=Auxenochlorella protothecoides TaxID=3075 RepID=A0A087SIB4_AUXPR|nr:putative serine/threonine-protein kinase [Auxenochlorella protothecoides]KFM25468.1 putative serine/threonine-protein kinase [Auxenochlorella protothecoides]
MGVPQGRQGLTALLVTLHLFHHLPVCAVAQESPNGAQPEDGPACTPGSPWATLLAAAEVHNITVWRMALQGVGLNTLLEREDLAVTLYVPLDESLLSCSNAIECGQEDTYWRGSLTSPEYVGLLLLHWTLRAQPNATEDGREVWDTALGLAQAERGEWVLETALNGSEPTVTLPASVDVGGEQAMPVLETFESCSGARIRIIPGPMVPDKTPITNLNDLLPLKNLCWSNIWSAMYHTPGELSLTDPGGAYLLYFLFQAFYSGTWPSLPSKFFYSSAMSNITFLIPGPDGMGKLTSQFGEIAADEPRKVYTLAGSYTLPGGYCPEGLVEAGRVNTQAGMLLGEDLSLDFEPGPGGDQVLISIPARPDLPPVAGTFLTTACFSTVILLNDTLRMWESAADIPPSPTLDPVPAVDQAALFNVGPGCGGGAPTVAVLSSHRGEPEGTLVEQSVQMPADDSSSGGSSLSAGAIAGIVIGSVAGAAALALLAVFLIRRRGRGRAPAARDEAWGDAASAKGGLTDHSDALTSCDKQSLSSSGTLLSTPSGASAFSLGLLPASSLTFDRASGELVTLGEGRFGKVYAGRTAQHEQVAIKCVEALKGGSDLQMSLVGFTRLEEEVAVLRRCRSRFIVNFIGVVSDPPRGQIMVVTERMMGGDLWHALRRGEVAWAERGWRLAMDIASGLAYLSTRRIVHNDLKSSNILLDWEGRAKISDVGLARIIPDSRSYLPSRSAEGGSFQWCAPEAILGEPSTVQSDMYSYGVVLWELITGEVPVRGHTREVRTPEECPAEVAAFMEQCRERKPSDRPLAQEAVALLRRLYCPDQE